MSEIYGCPVCGRKRQASVRPTCDRMRHHGELGNVPMLTSLERDAAVRDGAILPMEFVPDRRLKVGKSVLVKRAKEAVVEHRAALERDPRSRSS